jgi:hypothetical protein
MSNANERKIAMEIEKRWHRVQSDTFEMKDLKNVRKTSKPMMPLA